MGLGGALPNMRVMYQARPDWVMVGADYSQLELRVMAAVSKDEQLEANLQSGDVYTEDAKACFGLPSHMTKCDCKVKPCAFPDKHVKGGARKAAKIVHLGFQYGAGTPTIYTQALEQDRDIKYGLIKEVHDKLKSVYAGTVRYWFREQELVRQQGFSESRILGRRRSYPREPELTAVANYPIQATASDVANLAMLALDKRLRPFQKRNRAALLLQLHDAFYLEAHPDVVEDVVHAVKESMEQPFEIEGRTWVFPTEIKFKVQDGKTTRYATHWSEL